MSTRSLPWALAEAGAKGQEVEDQPQKQGGEEHHQKQQS